MRHGAIMMALVSTTFLSTTACGKKAGTDPAPAATAEPTKAATGEPTKAEPMAEADAATPEPVKPEPAPEPEKPLLAGTYDGRLLTPSAFAKTFGAWNDKDVVFAGHPMFFFDNDVLKGSVNFNAEPANSKDPKSALVGCTMKTDSAETFDKKKVLVMKGHIKGLFDKRIELVDCEQVAVIDAMPEAMPAIDPDGPEARNTEKPMWIKDFYDALHGWTGKELHFRAHFNGSTSSHNDYGDSIRIDLYDEGGGLFDKWISCYVDSLPTPEQSDTKKLWHIKGEATGGVSFDRPKLEHCTFVEELH